MNCTSFSAQASLNRCFFQRLLDGIRQPSFLPKTNTPHPLLTLLLIPFLLVGAIVSSSAVNAPRETPLLIEIQTPIIANGTQVGLMKLPAGTTVTVVSELPDGAMVSRVGFPPFKVAKAAISGPDTVPAPSSSPTTVTAAGAKPARPPPAVAGTPSTASQTMPNPRVSTSKVPVLAATGVDAGLAVMIGPTTLDELTALTNGGTMLVEALLPDRASADALREQVAKTGQLGLISVKQQFPGPLPYVGTSVNLLIADLDAPGAPDAAEIARVVAPYGATYLRRKGTWAATRIPLPASMDEWGQANKGPEQNAWSADQFAGPITGLRWFAPHSFFNSGKIPMRMVGGRVFTVDMDTRGQQNKMQIEARDAMNGTLLWTAPTEFPLGSNADSHREFFVANGRHLYTYPRRDGPLICFDARTGAVVREFKDGPSPVPAKGGPTADRDNWMQLLGAQIVLADKYVISILGNSLRVYDDATGTLAWNKVFPEVVRMRASVAHGRLYLVVQEASLNIGRHPGTRTGFSSMTAYDLVTGKDLWKSDLVINPGQAFIYLPPTVVGDQLVLAIKYYKLEGAKSAGSNAGDLSAGWLFAGVDAATGKTRWKESTKDCGGTIDASIWWVSGHWVNADGILWIGYVNRATGIDTKNGKLFKSQEIRGWNCHWSRGAGKWYTASQNFLNTDTLGMSLGNAVRTGCNDGLFFAYGANYIWSQSCPCGLFLTGKAATVFSEPPKPLDDARRLETFAPVTLGLEVPAAKRWPTYMGTPERSGITPASLPVAPKQVWKTDLGKTLTTGLAADWATDSILRPLTPPVVEGKTLVVARPHAHSIVGLDAETGTVRWTTLLGGRIDSAPTLYRGFAYVGCRDGYVYCLGLDDGKIRWRYLVATNREQMTLASQLESKWPVLGTTLLYDGALYACAGRHSQLDGGLTVAKLDPHTGKQIWRSTVCSIRNYFNSILNEPLLANGGRIWMSKVSLDPRDGKVEDLPAIVSRDKAVVGFNDPPIVGQRLPSDNVPSNTGENRMSGKFSKMEGGFPGMVGLNQSILVPGTFVQTRGGSCLNAIFDEQGTILAGIHGFSSKGSGTTPWGLRFFAKGVLASDSTTPAWINKNATASSMVANSTHLGVVNLANKGNGNVMFAGAPPSTWSVFSRTDGTQAGEPLKLPATVTWRGTAAADDKLWFSFEDGSVGCWK